MFVNVQNTEGPNAFGERSERELSRVPGSSGRISWRGKTRERRLPVGPRPRLRLRVGEFPGGTGYEIHLGVSRAQVLGGHSNLASQIVSIRAFT